MHRSETRQANKAHTLVFSFTPLLTWTAFGLALVVAYMGLAAGRVPLYVLYNSDALYLPALYHELTSGQGLHGWSLTPAPYFFPDMPLFFGLSAVLHGFRLAIIVYGLVQVLLFVAGLIALTRLMAGRDPHIQNLIPLASALFFLYFYAAPFPSFSPILLSAFHFSVMVVGVGCLALIGATLARPRIDRTVIAGMLTALLFSTLMVASDLLYAVQILAPLMLGLWLLALLKRITYRRALFYSLLGLSLPIGLWLGRALSHLLTGIDTRFVPRAFDLQKQQVALHQLLDWLQWLCLRHPFLPIAAVCFTLVIGRILLLLHKREPSARSNVRFLILSFLVLQMVASVLSMLYNGIFSDRYLLPLLVMPTFFGWPLLAAAAHKPVRILNNPQTSQLAAGAVILSCLVILAYLGAPRQLGRLIDHYPDLVRCMDEQTQQRGLQSGLSDYWQAKYISMLSRDGLRVVQLDPGLNPWHLINNRDWYAQPFDFVMVNHAQVPDFRLDRALIIARFGPPDDSFWCGKSEILVYRSREFREQFLTRFP